PGANKKAVNNVSFDIQPGKTVVLVGASGGGKTTIARLAARFWEVTEGEVSIGGINVKNIAHNNLMENLSFVFQNTRLFKTTLLENIKYGNPKATMEEVNRAVDLAQCRGIIDRLPDGLYTKIGTEGTYLSGGEQQRIALARAFLKNAPIVLLDEATAFTDPENEHLIQQALKKLAEDKTVLMIAHRLTSVVNADTIFVINEGKIAEHGTHNELLKKQGIYTNMWSEYQQSVHWTIGRKELSHV
ncbi:MAG: ABC transporter ATP-binding protein, partial [Draconibacterium sp.]